MKPYENIEFYLSEAYRLNYHWFAGYRIPLHLNPALDIQMTYEPAEPVPMLAREFFH